MNLDLNGILDYQQNRYPYLMIDHATKIIPGKLSEGYKILKKDEWFFKVHWPSDPNMPGMLQIEALVQMGSLAILTLPGFKGKILYLTKADNLKFFKKIVMNDRLDISTTLTSWNRGIGQFEGAGYVEDKIACKAKFTLILPEIIKNFKVS